MKTVRVLAWVQLVITLLGFLYGDPGVGETQGYYIGYMLGYAFYAALPILVLARVKE